jgi:hypothetical protein
VNLFEERQRALASWAALTLEAERVRLHIDALNAVIGAMQQRQAAAAPRPPEAEPTETKPTEEVPDVR